MFTFGTSKRVILLMLCVALSRSFKVSRYQFKWGAVRSWSVSAPGLQVASEVEDSAGGGSWVQSMRAAVVGMGLMFTPLAEPAHAALMDKSYISAAKLQEKQDQANAPSPVASVPTRDRGSSNKAANIAKTTYEYNQVLPAATKATVNAAMESKTSSVNKLSEEVALEGAISRRDSNKARRNDLKTSIRTTDSKMSTVARDVVNLDAKIKGMEKKYQTLKSSVDKQLLNGEKAQLKETLSEKRSELDSLRQRQNKDSAELKSLENKAASDEENVNSRSSALKQKQISIAAKQAADKKKAEQKAAEDRKKAQIRAESDKKKALAKEYDAAVSKQKSIEQVAKRSIGDMKAMKENEKKFVESTKKIADKTKKLASEVQSLEQKLNSASSELENSKSQMSTEEEKLGRLRADIATGEAVVKDNVAALNSITSTVSDLARKVKK